MPTFSLTFVTADEVRSPSIRRVLREHDALRWGAIEAWRAELEGAAVWIAWLPSLGRAAVRWTGSVVWIDAPELGRALAELFGAELAADRL